MPVAASILGGLLILVAGGELLVRGAVRLATSLGISPLVVGLVLVGFGTSSPELVTSLLAAFRGSSGIAIGNVVGSNICNILLILGAAATISAIPVSRSSFIRDGVALAGASAVLLGIVLAGEVGRLAGSVLLLAMAFYIATVYQQEKKASGPGPLPGSQEATALFGRRVSVGRIVFDGGLFSLGLLMVFVGARFLVDGSISMAQAFGISDAVIGLTVVAIGTSLPELVASVMAALRGQAALGFGNVIGSNLYNILCIVGVTAVVHPLEVPEEIVRFDIWVMLGATALLFLFTLTEWKIRRSEGAFMLATYFAYMGWLVLYAR